MKLTRTAATAALIAGSLAQAGLAQVTALGAGERGHLGETGLRQRAGDEGGRGRSACQLHPCHPPVRLL